VVEDDDSSAKYDISKGILSISLTKVVPGEVFPDLDLTNRLLARTGETIDDRGQVKGPPRIQVVQDPSTVWDEGDFDEALLYDFQFPQTIDSATPTTGGKYGFNNQYSGHFVHLQNPEVTSIPDIEEKSSSERWEIMRKQEDEKFDKEWYLADLLEPPEDLDEILKYTLPQTLNNPFTAEEQQSLRTLGNRDCTPLCILMLI